MIRDLPYSTMDIWRDRYVKPILQKKEFNQILGIDVDEVLKKYEKDLDLLIRKRDNLLMGKEINQ